MTVELAQRLRRLLDTIEANGNPVTRHLTTAPAPADQRRLAAAHGAILDDDVLVWFAIVGGTDPASPPPLEESALAPDFHPLTLAEALQRRAELVAWHGNARHSDMYIPGIEHFVPLGRCAMLLHGAVGTAVHRFDPPDAHDTFPTPRWHSIDAMATDWQRRWDDGRFRYQPGRGVWEPPQ